MSAPAPNAADFHREATTVEDAIRSAGENIRTAGYESRTLNGVEL